MAQLCEGSCKAQMHKRKFSEKFRKHTAKDIEIAMARALQEWSGKIAELKVIRTDKANQELKGHGIIEA